MAEVTNKEEGKIVREIETDDFIFRSTLFTERFKSQFKSITEYILKRKLEVEEGEKWA